MGCDIQCVTGRHCTPSVYDMMISLVLNPGHSETACMASHFIMVAADCTEQALALHGRLCLSQSTSGRKYRQAMAACQSIFWNHSTRILAALHILFRTMCSSLDLCRYSTSEPLISFNIPWRTGCLTSPAYPEHYPYL